MEPNETQHNHLSSSYFITSTAPATTTPSATNGILLSPPPQPPNDTCGVGGVHMLYPHSSTATVNSSPVEPAIRKRGRPRKYGTPEQALAAKKSASLSSNSLARERREAAAASSTPSFLGSSSSTNFRQSIAIGNAGQGFTPHIISVAAGEPVHAQQDVAQKIFLFMQQNRHEMCILSASGSISNASLRQPATSGGSITYEGRFEIISLSGSYVRTDLGGRTGGISVCLSSTDGQIIGGGIDGPLIAGGPVQVIVGTFVLDNKDSGSGVKVDTSTSKLPSPVGGISISNIGFCSPVESSGRNPFRGNDDHQTIGGNPFMIHPQGMHDWSGGEEANRVNAAFELTGRTGHGTHQSPENGDYDQYSD